MNLLLGHVLWLTGTLSISLSWEIRRNGHLVG